MMKYLMVATLTLLTATSAFAKKDCTNLPKDKWMTEAEFKKQAEAKGYKITKFKQPGSCYEIYGTNKEGKEVEVYFNPVGGAVVKEKLED
ncbi:MAG: PepSY domain-containing protein [Bacteriovoracaceae bacterium]|nr:PepSY domain-containing protein [Bacteriovoracaceae bacterium]